jgi:putative photosynthetic complex assembly protein 2
MTDVFSSIWGAALFSLLSWWLGTGAILWLVRLPAATFRWSMFGLSFLLGLSLWTAAISMRSHTVLNAYIGFVSVIAMWSWHEMAFLTGWLTGPRRVVLDRGLNLRQRFIQSLQVLLHHELALVFNFGVLVAMQQGHPNHMALCTFALLWCMRLSAKLNLFFGVPFVGEQYLPVHLRYIGSYFKQAPVTLCFYLTMGASCVTWAWMVWEVQSGLVLINAAWVLLCSLLGLAIIEHLLMVFAMPLQNLWSWAMKRSPYRLESASPDLPVPVVLPNRGDPA